LYHNNLAMQGRRRLSLYLLASYHAYCASSLRVVAYLYLEGYHLLLLQLRQYLYVCTSKARKLRLAEERV
jgi:hypothetical protein